MNLKEVLKLADEIVFTQTGQHLDDLQEAVLRGTLQRETYKQIAKKFDCSESRIRENGLVEVENRDKLIHRYQGNPLWLKTVAIQIQELGGGVTSFLSDDIVLLPEDLKDILQQQCDRLSETEKQLLTMLAKESDLVNLAKLLEKSRIPPSDLLNALQSLSRRCLIEHQASFYTLSPVLRQYINNYQH